MSRFIRAIKWASQMGMRYILFRLLYEFQLKSGLLRIRFPTNPEFTSWITMKDWKRSAPVFFFDTRETITINQLHRERLKTKAERIKNGELQFFNGEWKKVPLHDWLTNWSTGHIYSNQLHWTEIPDFDKGMGDIKYVWEKSRFGFIQTILRYDAALKQDSSAWVLGQIDSWIDNNPVNQGPNFRCSQEMSLRIFNWILALYFYRDSAHLDEAKFQKIIFSIYWQFKHIRSNINFSRIAVRNNHAIAEALALYTAGLLFPFFPESRQWKEDGRRWFEEEILYQIYSDGSYLQFSFNYHRVVIQLLTWALSISRMHGEVFSDGVYDRAYQSVQLLAVSQDRISGGLPNYGANDGSLFFNWNDEDYHNFSPSLDALHFILTGENLYTNRYEDRLWFGLSDKIESRFPGVQVRDGCYSFTKGGIYVYRRESLLVFIPCVSYKDRPSQADNLHLDVWYNGVNLLRDAGSYLYNTDPALVKYFFGTASHNTVMLEDWDQMEKGLRFIWWDWTDAKVKGWLETDDNVVFEGTIHAFKEHGKITHSRKLVIDKKTIHLQLEDLISGVSGLKMRQLWHVHPDSPGLKISISKNQKGKVEQISSWAFYSPTYGLKEVAGQIEFVTVGDNIQTDITL